MPELPTDLLRNIVGSQVELVSWNLATRELILRVTKEIVPETGLIRLHGVRVVHIPPWFKVAGMGAYDRPFPDNPDLELHEGEFAVVFQEAGGSVYSITAEALVYRNGA